MADRYCTNCGQELRQDDRFCTRCGRPVHVAAQVPTPEADVPVPALPDTQEPIAEAASGSGSGFSKNGAIVGAVVFGLVLLGALFSGDPNAAVLVAIVGVGIYVVYSRSAKGGGDFERLADGRLLLRSGFEHPISEAERSRLLDEEVSEYLRDGFFLRSRTAYTAQLTKPKKFSFLWAFLWLLLFGVGLIVYIIYYAAKRDEGRYVEIDDYGTVVATRQIHRVL